MEAATHALTETLRLDPNYQRAHELANAIKQAHYNRGITYLNDERYSEAVTAFQNAITLDPDFTTAHYNLGLTYLKMETYPRAVDALQKTVTLDRNYKVAYHSLALAYLGQQELGKARDAARDTLKLDANYQPAISLLEAIDPSFTPPETQAATPSEPEQPSRMPSNATDVKKQYERGEAFLNNGQYNEAAAAFKRVIKADPNFADAHYSLGVAYLEMGALDDAKTAAEEASRLKGDRQLIHELLTAIRHIETNQRRERFWKKSLSYTTVLGIIGILAFFLWPKPAPPDPILSIIASLEEPSGNGFLDAGETGRIRLTISNKGGPARNVELRFEPPSIAGLTFRKPTMIPELRQNSIETIRIPITADRRVRGRDQAMEIQLFGENRTLLTTNDFSFTIIPVTPEPERPRR